MKLIAWLGAALLSMAPAIALAQVIDSGVYRNARFAVRKAVT